MQVILDDGEVVETTTVVSDCCTPIVGDPIFGHIIDTGVVSVHHAACVQARRLRCKPSQLVDLTWTAAKPIDSFRVVAVDRHRLLSDIIVTLSRANLQIINATLRRISDGHAVAQIDAQIHNGAHLEKHLNALRRVPDVLRVRWIISGQRSNKHCDGTLFQLPTSL